MSILDRSTINGTVIDAIFVVWYNLESLHIPVRMRTNAAFVVEGNCEVYFRSINCF